MKRNPIQKKVVSTTNNTTTAQTFSIKTLADDLLSQVKELIQEQGGIDDYAKNLFTGNKEAFLNQLIDVNNLANLCIRTLNLDVQDAYLSNLPIEISSTVSIDHFKTAFEALFTQEIGNDLLTSLLFIVKDAKSQHDK